eukprot:1140267-Pelagomonas_calceolata.AAC.11
MFCAVCAGAGTGLHLQVQGLQDQLSGVMQLLQQQEQQQQPSTSPLTAASHTATPPAHSQLKQQQQQQLSTLPLTAAPHIVAPPPHLELKQQQGQQQLNTSPLTAASHTTAPPAHLQQQQQQQQQQLDTSPLTAASQAAAPPAHLHFKQQQQQQQQQQLGTSPLTASSHTAAPLAHLQLMHQQQQQQQQLDTSPLTAASHTAAPPAHLQLLQHQHQQQHPNIAAAFPPAPLAQPRSRAPSDSGSSSCSIIDQFVERCAEGVSSSWQPACTAGSQGDGMVERKGEYGYVPLAAGSNMEGGAQPAERAVHAGGRGKLATVGVSKLRLPKEEEDCEQMEQPLPFDVEFLPTPKEGQASSSSVGAVPSPGAHNVQAHSGGSGSSRGKGPECLHQVRSLLQPAPPASPPGELAHALASTLHAGSSQSQVWLEAHPRQSSPESKAWKGGGSGDVGHASQLPTAHQAAVHSQLPVHQAAVNSQARVHSAQGSSRPFVLSAGMDQRGVVATVVKRSLACAHLHLQKACLYTRLWFL